MLLFTSELNDTIHFLVWDRDAAQFVTCQQLFHARPTSVAVTSTSSTTHMIGIASALQDVAVFSTVGLGPSRQLVKLQTLATGPGHYFRALTLRIHLIPTAESPRELEDLKCFAHWNIACSMKLPRLTTCPRFSASWEGIKGCRKEGWTSS